MIAVVYAGLEERNKAFEWLEKSVDEHDLTNWCAKVVPYFNNLHSDQRWAKLMIRMGSAG